MSPKKATKPSQKVDDSVKNGEADPDHERTEREKKADEAVQEALVKVLEGISDKENAPEIQKYVQERFPFIDQRDLPLLKLDLKIALGQFNKKLAVSHTLSHCVQASPCHQSS